MGDTINSEKLWKPILELLTSGEKGACGKYQVHIWHPSVELRCDVCDVLSCSSSTFVISLRSLEDYLGIRAQALSGRNKIVPEQVAA